MFGCLSYVQSQAILMGEQPPITDGNSALAGTLPVGTS